jgi:predicted dehydrogenase
MPLTVGVVGLGRGMGFVNVFGQRPDCELVAVCDSDREKARRVASDCSVANAFDSYAELVDLHPDVIVVATPLPFHAEHSILALDAGIHVLSEVPAVNSIAEGRALVAAVRRSSAKYSFAENMAYAAYMQTYEQMVRSGALGRIYYAECEYIHDVRYLFGTPEAPTWRVPLPPIQYCTHDLGPLVWWLDDRVVTTTAMATGNLVDPRYPCIDAEVGLFRTAKGTIIRFTASFCTSREPAVHGLVLHGTKGVIEAPRCGWDKHKVFLHDIPNLHDMFTLPIDWNHTNAPAGATAGGHGTAEWFMIDDFVRSILDDTAPPFDVYTAMDMTIPGICAHESAMNGGQPVEVPDLRET